MIFVNKGDTPLTEAQLSSRTQAYIDRDFPSWQRERSIRLADGLFDSYMATVVLDTDVNRANNLFNEQLRDYNQATERLTQYELEVGQVEVIEAVPTGEQVLDEVTGQMVDVTQDVVTKQAIEPLPLMVEETVYDEATDTSTVQTVTNPLIVDDRAERIAAQDVVTGTPAEVVTFASTGAV